MRLFSLILGSCAAMLMFCTGCDVQPVREEPEPAPPPSPWRSDRTIAVPAGDLDEALEAAIAQAQETVNGARQQWETTPESLRSRWAIKWAAPTADGGIEYLWVQPLHWSPFRIEGLLASDPVNELHTPFARNEETPLSSGDLVALPIEQLADWVHFLEGDPDGPREGGFTIEALESRFGKPPERDQN